MTVYKYPMPAAQDSTGTTVVLRPPGNGIPAGSLICVLTYGDAPATQIGDTPGNIYKQAQGQGSGLWLWYTYNIKALRQGDTISVRKGGNGTTLLAMACGFSGIVTSVDPLVGSQLFGGFNSRPLAAVTKPAAVAGDLLIAALEYDNYDSAHLFVEDAVQPWNSNDFLRFGFEGSNPIFGATLVPRPAGAITYSPQVTPQQGNWLIVAAAFTAAVTIVMPAPAGVTVGSPALVPGIFSIFGKVVPIGITVGSLFIEAPTTGIEAPQVVCLTYRDQPDIQEALFTNTNVAFGLELQPNSLVGSTEPVVGMAERITVLKPLILAGKTLSVDPANPALDALTARVTALEIQMAAALGGITQTNDNLSALNDIVTVMQTSMAELQQAVFGTTGVGGHIIANVVVGSPAIGTPTLAPPGGGGN